MVGGAHVTWYAPIIAGGYQISDWKLVPQSETDVATCSGHHMVCECVSVSVCLNMCECVSVFL